MTTPVADDLAATVASLNAQLNKSADPPVPTDPLKESHGLLAKALDLIGRLVPGRPLAKADDGAPCPDDDKHDDDDDDAGDPDDDKELEKAGVQLHLHQHAPLEKEMDEDEDKEDDKDMLMQMLQHLLGHEDDEEDDDMGKSVSTGALNSDAGVLVVNGILQKSLRTQASLDKRLHALEKTVEGMVGDTATLTKSVTALTEAMTKSTEHQEAQTSALEAVTKGMMTLIERQGTGGGSDAPAESRYERMSKAMKPRLGPEGGHAYPYNKDMAAQLLVKGTLTDQQHRIWKFTGRLPDGVQLAS